MKKQSKKDLLNSLEDQVELHLQDAVKIFQNLTADELLAPAENEGWSIAQCLWHLNSYGNYYFPQISLGLQNKYPESAEFKSTWLGNYFTGIMQPGPKMKKYSAFKHHVPPRELNAHVVVAEFIRQQEQLLRLLESARSTDLNRVRIPISMMRWIKLKLGDVFQFIIAHDERHIQQAKRNLKRNGV